MGQSDVSVIHSMAVCVFLGVKFLLDRVVDLKGKSQVVECQMRGQHLQHVFHTRDPPGVRGIVASGLASL